MLKRILVCLDGSKFSEGILPFAIERANQFNSKIVLLKVANLTVSASFISMPITSGESVPMIVPMHLDDIFRAEEEKDRMYLASVVIRLRGTGLDADYVTRYRLGGDSIGDTIVAHGAENGFDLIIMATHRHNFWGRLIFGSVTESVIRKSAIPVLVVRPKETRLKEDVFNERPQAVYTT